MEISFHNVVPYVYGAMALERKAPKRRPTGGHRASGYEQRMTDILRMLAAKRKRERRGAKLQRDYDRCLANNPCLGR